MKDDKIAEEESKCDEEFNEESPGWTEWISKVAREASQKAAAETLGAGIPICIVEGDYIVNKYPDGHTERIKKLENRSIKAENRVYKL